MAKRKSRKPAETKPTVALAPTSPSWEAQWLKNIFQTQGGQIFILLAVPLFVRVLHFLFMLSSPLFRDIVMTDSGWYQKQAVSIASGIFAPQEGFYRPPFYSFFMALVYAIFGTDIMLIRLLQCLLGSVNCYLTFRLGERFFSTKVAWIAWAITAFYGPLFLFDNEILSPVWIIFFNLLLLLAISFAEGTASLKWWSLSGLWLGMSSITHANILPFLPVVLIWLIWRTKRWWDINFWLIPAVSLLILAILPGALVGIRNKLGYGEFIFIAHQGGLTLYVSNNPEAEGLAPVLPGKPDFTQSDATNLVAQETKIDNPSPMQVADYFSQKAREFITSNPKRFAMLTLKRFYHLFSSFEGSNEIEYFSYTRGSLIRKALFWHLGRFYFPSGVIIPLALCGMIMSASRWRKTSILHLYLAFQLLPLILFFVVARFRLPSVPVWALFAGVALSGQWSAKAVTRTQVKTFIVLLIALLFLVNADFWGASNRISTVGQISSELEQYMSASDDRKKGNVDEAIVKYEKAKSIAEKYLQVEPNSPVGQIHIATIYSKLGLAEYEKQDTKKAAEYLDKALEHAERAVKLSPDRTDSNQALAEVYRDRGHFFTGFADDTEVRQCLIDGKEAPQAIQYAFDSYKKGATACRKAIETAEPYKLNLLMANILYRHAGVMEYLARTAKEVRKDNTWMTFQSDGKKLIEETLTFERRADHYYLYGLFFLMVGDTESAKVQFNTALDLDIFHPGATAELNKLEGKKPSEEAPH